MYCLTGPAAGRTSLPNETHIIDSIKKRIAKDH